MPLPDALVRARGVARSLALYYGPPGRARRLDRWYGAWIKPGDLCLDIGAHVGDRSRSWSRLGARVVALEPQPDLARLLRWLFRHDPRVTVREQAVAAEAGRLPLYVSPATPTVTTMSGDWQGAVRRARSFARVRWGSPRAVEATTLDALLGEIGVPAFCKIDVEGFEAEVLRGLSRPLPALSFEYIPAAPAVARACVDQLEALARHRYRIAEGESMAFATATLDADSCRAWLAARDVDAPSGDVYAWAEAG